MQILQPQRRVDMLRDIMDAQRHQRPYVVTFCGVNGVGKSTNLAKVGAVPQAESDIVSAAFSVSACNYTLPQSGAWHGTSRILSCY